MMAIVAVNELNVQKLHYSSMHPYELGKELDTRNIPIEVTIHLSAVILRHDL